MFRTEPILINARTLATVDSEVVASPLISTRAF